MGARFSVALPTRRGTLVVANLDNDQPPATLEASIGRIVSIENDFDVTKLQIPLATVAFEVLTDLWAYHENIGPHGNLGKGLKVDVGENPFDISVSIDESSAIPTSQVAEINRLYQDDIKEIADIVAIAAGNFEDAPDEAVDLAVSNVGGDEDSLRASFKEYMVRIQNTMGDLDDRIPEYGLVSGHLTSQSRDAHLKAIKELMEHQQFINNEWGVKSWPGF